jgi:hypothetical protein
MVCVSLRDAAEVPRWRDFNNPKKEDKRFKN